MTNATDALRARLAEVLALRREAENEPLGSLGRMQAQGNFKDSAVMFFHDFGDETLAALATPAGSASGEVHRFDPSVQQIGGGDSEPHMVPVKDGDYVRFADYAALQAEVARHKEYAADAAAAKLAAELAQRRTGAEAARLREELEQLRRGHGTSHQCKRCGLPYNPLSEDEDCPDCGYDGRAAIDAAMGSANGQG